MSKETNSLLNTPFTNQIGIKYPIICGPMYPCSNPELIAAVSEAGGIGVVQPLSLVYVHGYELRAGLQAIRKLTAKPYGFNIIVEQSSHYYEMRMKQNLEIALEEGCRFFVTSLGNPKWVVDLVKKFNGSVYHDVTAKNWANKAVDAGVDGLICVNNRAGGHAGTHSAQFLFDELNSFGLPLICAGGIGDEKDFINALKMGYAGVQMGTRFIATSECREKTDYKNGIIKATENDIILTERVTGIPLSVIRTLYVDKIGVKIGPIARFLFKYRITKRWMRLWYGIKAVREFKKYSLHENTSKEYWQAGKSADHIHAVESVNDIISRFVEAAKNSTIV